MTSSSSSPLPFLILVVVYAATGVLATTVEVGDTRYGASHPVPATRLTGPPDRHSLSVIILFSSSTPVAHDVRVTRANYDDCTTSNPIATYSTGPPTADLTAAPRHPATPVSGAPTPPTTDANLPRSAAPGLSGSVHGVLGVAPSTSLGTAGVAATFGLTIIAAALML
ncbi:unnamed protein product [Spirodela intermedia]|uniref:Uncharacterized protein n=1 Tax=Spirodela intermedia TaxID=51605 RepID=A0A7I8JDQ8_SPIIN|nr:unnamed protein product [Spirodela intermedia]CAA6668141.1 unnamed protein product [Spirodela intermedia]